MTPLSTEDTSAVSEQRLDKIKWRLSGGGYVAGDVYTLDVVSAIDELLAARERLEMRRDLLRDALPYIERIHAMDTSIKAVAKLLADIDYEINWRGWKLRAAKCETCGWFDGTHAPHCNASAQPKSVAKRIAAQKSEPYPFGERKAVVEGKPYKRSQRCTHGVHHDNHCKECD
jgi:hypothetical protein